MQRALIVIILLFSLIVTSTRVSFHPLVVETTDEPDFTLVDSTLMLLQTGVYYFNVIIQNNGSGSATTDTVPHARENVYYELSLVNGEGILNESIINLDVNGDGLKTGTFNVTWFHDGTRQWDAVINNSHVYSLWEGPPEYPWRNQTHYIDGQSKLFELGSENHSLYFANETVAIFGLGDVQILDHAGPNFELEVDSSIRAPYVQIGEETFEVNYARTRENIAHGQSYNTTVHVVSVPKISNGTQLSFSCILVLNETKTVHAGLSLNWSPEGERKRTWRLLEQEIQGEAVELPCFLETGYELDTGDPSQVEFTATLQNCGTPATVGTMMIPWETTFYTLAIPGGEGTLNETIVDYDLNGDGDKTDTFAVSRFQNETRQGDVIVGGVHAYAIVEEGSSMLFQNASWYLDGKLKTFQLGSENHTFYCIWEDEGELLADFGFGLEKILDHPSPNYYIWLETDNGSVINDIGAANFRINGEPVSENHTWKAKSTMPGYEGYLSLHIMQNTGIQVATGEELKISATFTGNVTATFYAYLFVCWSPDRVTRYRWLAVRTPEITIKGSRNTTTTTTTTTATTTTTPPRSNPGFSYIGSFSLIVLAVVWMQKRKRRSF